MRLDKFISTSTPYSRREIKNLIKAGEITVNGELAKRAEDKVSEKDDIAICGESIIYAENVYLLLNKPQGYVSAVRDKNYPVVCDLVPEEYAFYDVFPVGRLDIDTEGLLILTNDGALDHRVTSPKKEVYKRYFARLDKPCELEDIAAFAAGMRFKEFTSRPAKLEICENPNEAYVEIAEGKFHQVKRMFEKVGKKVIFLKRISIGGLSLPEDLECGKLLELNKETIENLIFNE